MNATVAPSALGNLSRDATLMTKVRRQLNACPELGFAETRTASTVARLLGRWGFEVARGVGGTGVVASLGSGPGRRIGLRAELDALLIAEGSAAVHACGHDGHMAILLAAGRYLARTRRFSGVVRLIFQPAEEGLGGAERMLDDGLLERFPCDAFFALHNAPDQPADTVAARPGVMAAFGDWLEVCISTEGGHAASSGDGVGAVVVAASIVMALQTVASWRTSPFEPAIVHVGSLHGGSCAGVSASSARLLVTVRTLDAACRARVLAAVVDVIRAQAACHGARAEIVEKCSYPRLVNSVDETRLIIETAREVVGDRNVFPPSSVRPIMASDDFAVLLARRPGCYFLLGTQGGGRVQRLHHPEYDFNDECLRTGASLLARLVERYLPTSLPQQI